jgi:cytochrome bd ubiquinol oxidase subunit II
MDLNVIWFLLIGLLFVVYAILDGFDLGVGILHLFAKDDHERRVHMNAIGPVWDGNEVWLITAGAGMFAAFPVVYATVFSGFYLAVMLLLVALVGRAVAMEFRGLVAAPRWRRVWDTVFAVGSFLAALLLSVAFGNVLRGLPIDENYFYAGEFFGLLNPYALLVGVLGVAMLTMHGAAYLFYRSEGALHERMRRFLLPLWVAFVALYVAATAASVFAAPHLFEGKLTSPVFWLFTVLTVVAVVSVPIALRQDKPLRTLLATGGVVCGVVSLGGVGLFPRLVPSRIDLAYSLTLENSAAGPNTLRAMLIITLIGMPLVLGYTFFIYRIFKGKVVVSEDSY